MVHAWAWILLGSVASSPEAASSMVAVESLVPSGGGNEVLGGRRRLRHRASHGAPSGAGHDACTILCISCRSSHPQCASHPGMPPKNNNPTHQARKLCLPELWPHDLSLVNLCIPRLESPGSFSYKWPAASIMVSTPIKWLVRRFSFPGIRSPADLRNDTLISRFQRHAVIIHVQNQNRNAARFRTVR